MSTETWAASLSCEVREAAGKLASVIRKNLPAGFEETADSALHFRIPLSAYPPGYHCTPGQALPFLTVAARKPGLALYHMGLYADKDLHAWFLGEYPRHARYKADAGKSCFRFKRADDIPLQLIGELCRRMSPEQWILLYESRLRPGNK